MYCCSACLLCRHRNCCGSGSYSRHYHWDSWLGDRLCNSKARNGHRLSDNARERRLRLQKRRQVMKILTDEKFASIPAMIEQGISKAEIAAMCGVTKSTLQVQCSRRGVSLRPGPRLVCDLFCADDHRVCARSSQRSRNLCRQLLSRLDLPRMGRCAGLVGCVYRKPYPSLSSDRIG